MKRIFPRASLIAASVLLVGTAVWPTTASAQRTPGGSYLESCREVRMMGNRLSAECRRADGRWSHAEIDAARCNGGIANNNGLLTCNGGQVVGQGGGDWNRGREESRDHDWNRGRDEGRDWGRDRGSGYAPGYGSSAPYYPGYGR